MVNTHKFSDRLTHWQLIFLVQVRLSNITHPKFNLDSNTMHPKFNLDSNTMHPKFNLSKVQTDDLQIMDSAFYVPEMRVLTIEPSGTYTGKKYTFQFDKSQFQPQHPPSFNENLNQNNIQSLLTWQTYYVPHFINMLKMINA